MRKWKRLAALTISVIAFGAFFWVLLRLASDRNAAVKRSRHEVTEHAIWKLVSRVKEIAATNGLPANDSELRRLLGNDVPTNSWGGTLFYYRISSNHFSVTTSSPWPEVLVFQYDSRTNNALRKYPF